MKEPQNTPRIHELVAVYADPVLARRVASELADLGLPPSAVRVGDAGSRVAALKAEMREEVDQTIVGPGNIGPFTKEMTRGITTQVALWTVGLAIVGCALALFDWPASNLDFGARLVVAAVVGAATGATIGFVWGGARGASREPSGHHLAAERGVSVSVSAPAEHAARAVAVMRRAEPTRLDLGSAEGSPLETLETDGAKAAQSNVRRS